MEWRDCLGCDVVLPLFCTYNIILCAIILGMRREVTRTQLSSPKAVYIMVLSFLSNYERLIQMTVGVGEGFPHKLKASSDLILFYTIWTIFYFN